MMLIKKNSRLLQSLIAVLILAAFACKRKKTNEQLYRDTQAADLVFYKNKDTVYGAAGNSPHGAFKLKFNSVAAGALGPDGKLPPGESFPNGSLIVKEVYSGEKLSLYAVMKKDPGSKFAASRWLWAEYDPDGDTHYSVAKRGKGCTSCHSNSPARDLTRAFDLH